MDSTCIIGFILIAVIVIPLLLMSRGKNKKAKALHNALTNLTQNSIIAKQEEWNGCIIALDEINKMLFFVHQKKCNTEAESVDLTQYASCRVVTSSSLGTTSNAIDMVELVFTPKQKDAETKSLIFFNSDTDGFTLNGELQSAEHWKKYCEAVLK